MLDAFGAIYMQNELATLTRKFIAINLFWRRVHNTEYYRGYRGYRGYNRMKHRMCVANTVYAAKT